MGQDISFASFNLYNLQLPGQPTHRRAKMFTQESFERRLRWAAAILHQLDADLIAFQELWSAQALRELFAVGSLAEQYELHFIGNTWYDHAVAAAVRRPWRVKEKSLYKSFPDNFRLIKRSQGVAGADEEPLDDDEIDVRVNVFSRTVLGLTLTSDRDDVPDIETLCVHLKSKLPTELDPVEAANEGLRPHRTAIGAALATIRRTAEAAALRMIVTRLTKATDRPVAVVGDLNDGPHSNTLAILSAQPPFRRYHKSRAGSASDIGLYPATFLQALSDFQDVAYTHLRQGVREQLDHVLVSEQFYDYSRRRVWSFKEQRIWNDHLDENAPLGVDRATSDHGVVCARFLWDPAP